MGSLIEKIAKIHEDYQRAWTRIQAILDQYEKEQRLGESFYQKGIDHARAEAKRANGMVDDFLKRYPVTEKDAFKTEGILNFVKPGPEAFDGTEPYDGDKTKHPFVADEAAHLDFKTSKIGDRNWHSKELPGFLEDLGGHPMKIEFHEGDSCPDDVFVRHLKSLKIESLEEIIEYWRKLRDRNGETGSGRIDGTPIHPAVYMRRLERVMFKKIDEVVNRVAKETDILHDKDKLPAFYKGRIYYVTREDWAKAVKEENKKR